MTREERIAELQSEIDQLEYELHSGAYAGYTPASMHETNDMLYELYLDMDSLMGEVD